MSADEGARSALGREFSFLRTSSAISLFGDGIRTAALPLMAALVSRSPSGVSLVAVAGELPWLLLSLFSGVVVDRSQPGGVMWRVSTVQGIAVGAFAFWALVALPPLWTLVVLAFLLGAGETLYRTASTSLVPDIVRSTHLDRANSRLQGVQMVGFQFLGPLAGAAIFAAATGAPFVVDALSFVAAAVLIWLIRRPEASPPAPRGAILPDMAHGMRWLWGNHHLRVVALALCIATMGIQLGSTMLVLLIAQTLHASQTAYGIVLSVGAVGGLAASLFAGRLRSRLGPGRLLALSITSMGVAVTVVGLSTSVVLVGAMYALGSFGVVTWSVQSISLGQRLIPRPVMGRVTSAYRLVGWSGIPIGTALSGVIATAFGLRVPILVGGVMLLCCLALLPKLRAAHLAAGTEAGRTGVSD